MELRMDNKSIWTTLTEKVVGASKNETDIFGKLANIITTPASPGGIINMAKTAITAGIRQLQKNKEELRKFENDAAQTHKEVDSLEQMVQANWQKIKRCGSDSEYLQEEERMAQIVEEQLCKQHQQQKHIGN